MGFNPLHERGIPLERQLRNWSELNVTPYDTRAVHPYTRCRVIFMNGIEVESIINSHNFSRHTADVGVKQKLAMVRRAEQQQQKAVNWLIPGDESTLARTIGYEQVAVDLTSWLARHEPDPYLKKVYEFALLEDFDHLYRYANLMDLLGEGRLAQDITGDLTEILPGRPTIFQHRDPHEELNRPMTLTAASPQSVMNAITITAAEQQTMNFYMNVGNIPEHLQVACEMLRDVDGIEAESFLPADGLPEPMTFEPNKEYVRDVLQRTIEWTSWDSQFVPVTDLPPDHRYFEYQRQVNAGGVPTEDVINQHREKHGGEYRFATEGGHPIASLRENGPHDELPYWQAEARVARELEGVR